MMRNHTQCGDLLGDEGKNTVICVGFGWAQCYVWTILDSARDVFVNSFVLLPKPDGK